MTWTPRNPLGDSLRCPNFNHWPKTILRWMLNLANTKENLQVDFVESKSFGKFSLKISAATRNSCKWRVGHPRRNCYEATQPDDDSTDVRACHHHTSRRDGGPLQRKGRDRSNDLNQNFGVVREKRMWMSKRNWHDSLHGCCVADRRDQRPVQIADRPQRKLCWTRITSTIWFPPTSCAENTSINNAVLTKDGSRYSGSLQSFDANQLVIRPGGGESGDRDGAARTT